MSPPFYRDLWLAAALTSTAAMPAGIAQAAIAPVGVITSATQGVPAGDAGNTVHVGIDVIPGQQLQTGSSDSLHVLFLDQSALTLGPDSELTVDEFTYDPESQKGKIRLNLARGSLRIVGGYISKNEAAVITTPFSTIEVLGGISLIFVTQNTTQSTFLFGQQMRVSNPSGSQTVTRPGFSVSTNNGEPSPPTRLQPQQLTQMTIQFQTNTQLGSSTNPSSTPSALLVSTSDHTKLVNSPDRQLATDRVSENTNNTQQANPTLALTNLLNSTSSTIQS